jgi:hypothetical protein
VRWRSARLSAARRPNRLGKEFCQAEEENSRRKEVTTMPYNKPEMLVLGEASDLVKGARIQSGEVGDGLKDPPDCEIDD